MLALSNLIGRRFARTSQTITKQRCGLVSEPKKFVPLKQDHVAAPVDPRRYNGNACAG